MSAPRPQFFCDHCGKSYTWKPALAGRKAKCSCGQTIVVPQAPLLSAPSALHQPPLLPVPALHAPVAQAIMAEPLPAPSLPAVPALTTLGYGRPRPKRKQQVEQERLVSPIRDTYAPVVLLV